MSEKKPAQKKKMLITSILTILKEHTDAQRHLRQAPIMKLLEEEHQLTATRKSVRKNLGDLQEAGYPVKFQKGWYYDSGFTADEVGFLRTCVMGCDMPADKREDLLARLAGLGGPFYQPGADKGPYLPLSPEFPFVMNDLTDAIARGRMVTLTMRGEDEEKADRVRVSPCHLAEKNGTSYLVCRAEETDERCEIPVAGIGHVRILKQAAKTEEKAKE